MSYHQIDDYLVTYSSNNFRPRIALYADGAYLGQLVFHPNDSSTLPPDGLNGGQPELNYRLDDFHNAIEVLRKESPVYLFYNGDGSSGENGLQTHYEPVGEHEPALRSPRRC